MHRSKERILEAAEQVILRDGVAHLTLEAVAAEADLSKGGMLYHFRSKDDLIRGMIDRLLKGFEAEIQRLAEQDPCEKGRFTRAHLEASVPEGSSEACIRADHVCAALLAAVATNPSLLEPVQKARQAVMERLLDDGIDPTVAALVTLAADGIWMAELFGLHPLEPELRSAILRKLHEMTK